MSSHVAPAGFVSLAEQAYAAIEEKIVTLELAPGAVLSEQQLAGELGIGRSPVREALQKLAHEGLVVIMPRRGVLVSEINVSKQHQLLVVRREVERLMVREACSGASDAQRDEFLALAREFERAAGSRDVIEFMRHDARLNDLIADSVDNDFANKAMRLMRGLSRRFWFKYYQRADLKQCARLHGRLARAIAGRDADAAGAALDALIDYLEHFTRATLQGK